MNIKLPTDRNLSIEEIRQNELQINKSAAIAEQDRLAGLQEERRKQHDLDNNPIWDLVFPATSAKVDSKPKKEVK